MTERRVNPRREERDDKKREGQCKPTGLCATTRSCRLGKGRTRLRGPGKGTGVPVEGFFLRERGSDLTHTRSNPTTKKDCSFAIVESPPRAECCVYLPTITTRFSSRHALRNGRATTVPATAAALSRQLRAFFLAEQTAPPHFVVLSCVSCVPPYAYPDEDQDPRVM